MQPLLLQCLVQTLLPVFPGNRSSKIDFPSESKPTLLQYKLEIKTFVGNTVDFLQSPSWLFDLYRT
jgi:hypothetical protein